MRVVLFGAGASAGSGDVHPRVPPLGPELFAALRRLYGTWRSIPDGMAKVFDSDFEKGMAEIIEKHGFAVAPLMQEMATFFAIFVIPDRGSNRYVSLLKRLNDPASVLWSTLNYECLLEMAGSKLGHRISYFLDPGAKKELPVWKLHGSCNFRVTGLEAGRGVQFGSGVVFGGNIEPVDPSQVAGIYQGNTSLYPAMALYAAKKPVSMSPGPVEDAQRRWAAHVLKADRVAVVGVRPNPDDEHIWGPLSSTSAEIGYVGAERPFNSWITTHRHNKPNLHLGATWKGTEDALANFIGTKAGY